MSNAKLQVKVIKDIDPEFLAIRVNGLLNAMEFDPMEINYLTGVKICEYGERKTLYIAVITYRDVMGNAVAMNY